MKFRKPFRPKTRKITPARYRAIAEAVFIIGLSFWIGDHSNGVNHIDVNIIDDFAPRSTDSGILVGATGYEKRRSQGIMY
jgi:hypothetical protein